MFQFRIVPPAEGTVCLNGTLKSSISWHKIILLLRERETIGAPNHYGSSNYTRS